MTYLAVRGDMACTEITPAECDVLAELSAGGVDVYGAIFAAHCVAVQRKLPSVIRLDVPQAAACRTGAPFFRATLTPDGESLVADWRELRC